MELDENVTVFRVQNFSGKGPYNASDESWQDKPHSRISRCPGPHEDNIRIYELERQTGISSHKWLFGFKSLQQLHTWFTDSELQNLKKIGFEPCEIKAYLVAYGQKQVVFVPKDS